MQMCQTESCCFVWVVALVDLGLENGGPWLGLDFVFCPENHFGGWLRLDLRLDLCFEIDVGVV